MARLEASQIADALGWRASGDEYRGLCPCHEPSGTNKHNAGVKDSDSGFVFHCFAGCTFQDFLAHLKRLGLDPASSTNGQAEIARYTYHDADGNAVYDAVRFANKEFRMVRPNGQWSAGGAVRGRGTAADVWTGEPLRSHGRGL